MISMNLKEYVKYQLDSLVSMIYDSCMQKHQIFNQIAVKAEEVYQHNSQNLKDGQILEESLHQLKVMLQYINQDISAHIDLALQQLSVSKRIQLQNAPKIHQEEQEEQDRVVQQELTSQRAGDTKPQSNNKISGLLGSNIVNCNYLSNAQHFDSTLTSLNAQFNQGQQINNNIAVGSIDAGDIQDDAHEYNTRANKGKLLPPVVITAKNQSLGNNSSNLKSILINNGNSKFKNNNSQIVQTELVNNESQQQQQPSSQLLSVLLKSNHNNINNIYHERRQVSSELNESQGDMDQEWKPSSKQSNKILQRSSVLSQTSSANNKIPNSGQSSLGKGSNLSFKQLPEEIRNKMEDKIKYKKWCKFSKDEVDCKDPSEQHKKAFQIYLKGLAQFEEKYFIKPTTLFFNKGFFYFRFGKQGMPVIRYLEDEDREFVVKASKALGVQKRCSELLKISFQQVSRVRQLHEIAMLTRKGKNSDKEGEKLGKKQKKKAIIDNDDENESENEDLNNEVEEEESQVEENEDDERHSDQDQEEEDTVEKRKRKEGVVFQPMIKQEQQDYEEQQIQEKDIEKEAKNLDCSKDKQKGTQQTVSGLSGLKKMIRFPFSGASSVKEENNSNISYQDQKSQNQEIREKIKK